MKMCVITAMLFLVLSGQCGILAGKVLDFPWSRRLSASSPTSVASSAALRERRKWKLVHMKAVINFHDTAVISPLLVLALSTLRLLCCALTVVRDNS
ncbi:hypothetical protein DPX16_5350 [Anabarilius grahami]|uniref:Secreted protein n=1 Tax=Anabarilius grahami TaxID=495550 RepID=A0A3N0YD45_ANAGA|nr:hypothetical protein DPX16_5350 [Anabarilius grahami]